jgi:ribosomal protein S18 acetylase RimI-like enzyme
MQVRPATPDDVPNVLPMVSAICQLHQSWDPARFTTIDQPEKMYESWLRGRATDARSVFLVAEHDGRLVGYVVCTVEKEIPIYATTEFGWVHDLWIDPTYRNEGLGTQLTMLVIERFTEMGIRQIRLQTARENEVGRKLFAACGFEVSTIDMLMEL